MMKKRIIILSIFLLCLPIICMASSDYTIDKYQVEVSVNNKNGYDVEENIDVSFHKLKAIINKELPYNVSNLKINTNFDVVTTNKRLVTINSEGKTNASYKLDYTLPNNDRTDYYNIEIVNNYDGTIRETEFVINLPSSVTKENISFVYDGEDITDEIDYKIDGYKITGSYKKSLLKGDKLELNVKYNQIYLSVLNSIVIILPVVLTLISYYIWYRYGKDYKINIIKSFILPKELTPLDIALVKNEKVVKDDIFAFLLYMANKGYIKIVEEKNNEFYLERVKDYDGDNYQEELFLKSLFRKNVKVSLAEYIDLVSSKKEIEKEETLEKKISSTDLEYRYHRMVTNLLPLINNNEAKAEYYELEADKKKDILIVFVAMILILITLVPFMEINKLYLFPISIIIGVFALKILTTLVDFIDINNLNKKNNKLYTVLSTLLVVVICFGLLVPSFKRNLIYTLAFLISFISVIVILVLYKYMPKRTLYGSKIYGKVEGLRVFIDTGDKEDLDLALKKNKNYLYELLPFSYVLKNDNKVFDWFKNTEVSKPSWYKLKDDFTNVKFINSLKRLKNKIDNIKEEF